MRKMGESHHRTRWSNRVVERARLLRDRGYGAVEISRLLADEMQPAPKPDVIRDWIEYRTRTAA